MRKWTRVLLLAGLFALMLCGSALAADAASGICDLNLNITDAEAYTAVAQTSTGTDVTTTTPSGEKAVYANTEKIRLTVNNADSSKQYLVFVLKGDEEVPREENIFYIDQQAGGVNFNIYPKSLESGVTYGIFLSSTDTPITKIGSFGYYAPYMLGDVTGDKAIRANDATRVLNHVAENITLTGSDFIAADVTKDGNVRANDATRILNYVAENITSFD